MKRFKLEVGGKAYQAEGSSLEEIEGWEDGLPEVWKKNKKKIVVEDLTEEINKEKARAVLRKEYNDLLDDEDVIKERIKELKKLRKSAPKEPVKGE